MNTLSKFFTTLMLAGATSLMAADTTPAAKDNGTAGGNGGPRMHERGNHGPRGGHGRFSMLICPNCHHRLIVLAPDGFGKGGPGGREGRGGERGGRRGPGRRGAPPQKPQTDTQEK